MSLLDEIAARKKQAAASKCHDAETTAESENPSLCSLDSKALARETIERIYYVADDPTIKKALHELDCLVFWGENGTRAVQLAEQVRDWCTGGALEGKALADAVREIFGTGRAA